jgi:hypothetical protein
MSAESSTLQLHQSRDYRAILWGGLSAGILDILAAIINTAIRTGRGPLWVLQSIASAILGANSYKDGLVSGALRALIHFFNAFVICTIFFLASRAFPFLVKNWIISGLLYGVDAYFVMCGIVLRLTFHRNFLTPLSSIMLGVAIHMFCVGLPICLPFTDSRNHRVSIEKLRGARYCCHAFHRNNT